MTAAYAVIGWPLGHTLSPVMHQAALDDLGLDATYTALPTPRELKATALRTCAPGSWQG